MERSRLLASSDRASLLSTDSTGSVDTTKHRQQLGNYFTNNVYLTDPWNDEDYYYNQNPKPNHDGPTWRSKERLKTYGVALVVCLNIGTDPPDVIKPTPCARRECWFDPVGNKQQCLEYIGNALQSQYEKWQQKVKFKQCLDPTAEELRRICINLRKNSKNDRLLLHYNGHGVPKPTKNGELWVFGKHYTHYTPVAVYELRHWLSDPAVYVLDCSGAAVLIPHLVESVSIRANGGNYSTEEFSTMHSGQMQPDGPTIVFAACKENEVLPMNPMYPADMFTACLTTPVTIAIRWFILQVII